MPLNDRALSNRAARLETLLEDLESMPDPAARAQATEIIQDLLVLYGEGLARMLAIITARGDRALAGGIMEGFAGDDLISHLLLLHELHPVEVRTRVAHALDEMRPYLAMHGGDVELLGVERGVARVRLLGSCQGCPSSTVTLKQAIEDAIWKAAPDLEGIDAEGVAAPAPARPSAVPTHFVPISTVRKATHGKVS